MRGAGALVKCSPWGRKRKAEALRVTLTMPWGRRGRSESFKFVMLRVMEWSTAPMGTDSVASLRVMVAESVGVTCRETLGRSLVFVATVIFCFSMVSDGSMIVSNTSTSLFW